MSDIPEIEVNPTTGPRLIMTNNGVEKKDLCLTSDGNLALSGSTVEPLHFKNIPPFKENEETGTTGWSKKGFITSNLDAGDYEITLSFNWRNGTVSKSFRAEVILDGDYDNPIWEMEQRPRSSNNKQSQPATINIHINGITAGEHTIELWFSCEDTKKLAYMSNVYMKIKQES